ncbi:MAG: hypothetical protein AAF411_06850, partial [Myxococcota bacterium]
ENGPTMHQHGRPRATLRLKHFAWLLLFSCASQPSESGGAPTTSGDSAPSDPSEGEQTSEPGDGEQVPEPGDAQAPGGIIGVLRAPATPEEQAEREQQLAARRAAAEAERAAFAAQCASIPSTPGLPPVPPAHPSSLNALHATYTASLASAPTPPADRSLSAVNTWSQTVFAEWIQRSASDLRALEAAVNDIAIADRGYARGFHAHALCVFLEHFQDVPIPDEITRDPELRNVYIESLRQVATPLLDQAVEALGSVNANGSWGRWRVQMGAWIEQERCALQ